MERAFRTTSYPEQYIGFACKNTFKHVELNKRMGNGMEADIAIWDTNTIIEYNGVYWHKPERDERKKKFIESYGIRLIRIWDSDATGKSKAYAKIISENDIEFNRYLRDMSPVIPLLESLLKTKLVISDNMENDVLDFVNQNIRDQNLAFQYPDIAEELLDVDPSKLFITDSKTRRWKCKTCGTVFQTSVGHRVYNKTNCPACAGNIAIPGKTDILTVLPEYANEITSLTEEEKRNTLPFSTQTVIWKCSNCGYTWNSDIRQRTVVKTSCPKCGYLPLNINRDDFVDIKYLQDVKKPISQMQIYNQIYNVDIADAIGVIVNALLKIGKSLDNIVSLADLINNRSQEEKISYNSDIYIAPKLITTYNNKAIYIEGNAGTQYKINILKALLDTFNIKALFKIKDEYKLPKRITVAKNGVDFNVTTRISGKIVYIGRRRTVDEALRLKLSAEVYFFGNILIQSDLQLLQNQTIPDFKTMPEYEKFKDKYGGNNS
jgi:rubrerythrin/very-short-patch-repair endonuclease